MSPPGIVFLLHGWAHDRSFCFTINDTTLVQGNRERKLKKMSIMWRVTLRLFRSRCSSTFRFCHSIPLLLSCLCFSFQMPWSSQARAFCAGFVSAVLAVGATVIIPYLSFTDSTAQNVSPLSPLRSPLTTTALQELLLYYNAVSTSTNRSAHNKRTIYVKSSRAVRVRYTLSLPCFWLNKPSLHAFRLQDCTTVYMYSTIIRTFSGRRLDFFNIARLDGPAVEIDLG